MQAVSYDSEKQVSLTTNVNYRSIHLTAAWLSEVPHHARHQRTDHRELKIHSNRLSHAMVEIIARIKKEKVAVRPPGEPTFYGI